MSREERLAAKLRENLRRRKVQARALEGAGGGSGERSADHGESPADSGAPLSKTDPSG